MEASDIIKRKKPNNCNIDSPWALMEQYKSAISTKEGIQ